MLIALFSNTQKKQTVELAKEICDFLKKKKVQVVARDEEALDIGASPLSSCDLKAIDFSLCLGGDGTLLRLAQSYPGLEAPLLGINLGGLGFMADVQLSDLYPSLEDLLAGKYE